MDTAGSAAAVASIPPSDQMHNRGDNAYGIEIRVFDSLENGSGEELRRYLDVHNTPGVWACAVDLSRVACSMQLVSAAVRTAHRVARGSAFRAGGAAGDVCYNACHLTGHAEALKLLQCEAGSQAVAVVSVNGDAAFLSAVYGTIRGRAVENAVEWFSTQNSTGTGERLLTLAKLYRLTPQEMKGGGICGIQDSILTKIAVKEYIK
jgi:hypothetical protein